MGVKALAVRAAARAEQEIRAYPRLFAAVYAVMMRSGTVRGLVGRARDGVHGVSPTAVSLVEEPALLRARREAAVAARLGLR